MIHFHHIGLLVNDMDVGIENYKALLRSDKVPDIYTIHTQGVKVCFIELAQGNFIELVQPLNDTSVVAKMLKKGWNYYHIGYLTSNIESEVKRLEDLGYKAMEYFNSEAFGMKRCIFLFSPEAQLIELIEN